MAHSPPDKNKMTAASQCTARDSQSWTTSEGEREREQQPAVMAEDNTRRVEDDSIGKRGLAIIITNDYTTTPVSDSGKQWSVLNGTTKDGKCLKEAFEALNFEVQWRENIYREELMHVILELKRKPFDTVKHYRCMVLVFSGHGEKGGKLIMQDGREVDACTEFIDPLLPGKARDMGDIPKVFIIDACRGEDETETTKVPKLVTDKGSSSSVDPTPQDKGGYEIQLKDLPKKSNFLVAYSTLPGCISNDYHNKGSLWLDILAKNLPVSEATIEILLTDVNEELMKECQRENSHYKFQQPEKIVRLNSRLYLRDSVPISPAGNQEDPMETEPSLEQHKSPNLPTQACPQNQQLANQKVVQGTTSLPSQAARAQSMCTSAAASAHCGDNLNQKTQATPPAREKGSQTYYRDLLKRYTSPKYDYISEEMSSGVKRHRCNITFRHKGRLKDVNSGGYLTTKHGAAEHAAKMALKQEGWLP